MFVINISNILNIFIWYIRIINVRKKIITIILSFLIILIYYTCFVVGNIDYTKIEFKKNIEIINYKEIKFNVSSFLNSLKNDFDIDDSLISNNWIYGSLDNNNNWVAFSGSLVPIPDNYGYYFHISRVLNIGDCNYLLKFNDDIYNTECLNRAPKSFIYAEILNSNYEKVYNFKYKNLIYPRILDFYTPDAGIYSGAEDGRLFVDSFSNINVLFNMKDKSSDRSMWLYNVTTNNLQMLDLWDKGKVEKNWISFLKNNNIHYITSFKNTKNIITCKKMFGRCFSYLPYKQETSYFRGGSTLQNYGKYYVGMARSSHDCNCGKIYRPNIVILSEELDIIYISEPINYSDEIFINPYFNFSNVNQLPDPCKNRLIITPLTLTRTWNEEVWITEVSIADQKNIIILLKNFNSYIDSIIYDYENTKNDERIKQDKILDENYKLIKENCKLIEN
jgi:hypothetical protein